MRIENRRKELRLSKTDIWKGAGLSSGAYSHWMNGGSLMGENLIKVANILKVTPTWLETGLGVKDITHIGYESAPSGQGDRILQDRRASHKPRVVGTADMGDRGFYVDLEGGDGYLDFDSSEGAIAIHVRGHSMFPAIRDGWYIVIEQNSQLTIGEYVLLKFNSGKKMVKELLQMNDEKFVVMSVNGNERITALRSDLEDVLAISAVIPPSKHKEWQ